MLGSTFVGKTSISDRLIKKNFVSDKDSTIGSAYNRLVVDDVRYDIWDTAGQERYMAISEFYYRNANIALLVFDITKPDTISRIIHYYNKIKEINITNKSYFIIIGNKSDIATKEDQDIADRQISKHFPKEIYITVSAKYNTNIDQIMKNIIHITDIIKASKVKKNDTLKLSDNFFISEKNGCVC